MNRNSFKLTGLFSALLLLVLVSGCKKEDTLPTNTGLTEIDELVVDPNFNYNTTKNIVVNVNVLNNEGNPMPFLPIEVYQSDQIDSEEYLDGMSEGAILFSGATNSLGALQVELSVPTALHELVVATDYLGLVNRTLMDVNSQLVEGVIGGARTKVNVKSLTQQASFNSTQYATLGTWNSIGVPNYLLTPGDVLSQSLLDDINASLPESLPLPISHPDYFNGSTDFALHLTDSCDVWVTFVHEGAGWKNALGFYTYTEGNAPIAVDSITDLTIIFPNTSFAGSGGGLYAGDKVHLGVFGPNTVIEWFLVGQGWDQTNSIVNNGVYTHYSQIAFNQEADPTLKQHNILLYDETRELILLGFEDIRRDLSNCDQDFNDAVFYATANPITAVSTTNLKTMDTSDDQDNDGVSDLFDDYPTDPTKAFDNYYPAEGQFGTLAFEDLWPGKGDYDFNDIVVDYHYHLVTDLNSHVVEMNCEYVLRAMGAGYHNSFGIELPISSSLVTSVTGGDFSRGFISRASNGTETGQTNAVIIAFEDGYDVLGYPGSGIGINTTLSAPYVTPDTLRQTILFNSSVLLSDLGTAPFNPFIIVNQDRDYEVHLAGHAPTDKADPALFGTSFDDSDPSQGRYYKTASGLPFAINIPVSFDYPQEKQAVNQAHAKFNDWAESSGVSYPDWYLSNAGYRDNSKLYLR